MVNSEFLKTMGISSEDISEILEQDAVYGEKIEPIAQEYWNELGKNPFTPYSDEMEKAQAHVRANQYAKEVATLNPDKNYMLQLLAWLHLIPYLKSRYEELGIEESIFVSTMKDITYKINECKMVHGTCGVFVDFFFLNFDVKLFEIGRLQYEVNRYPMQLTYSYGDYTFQLGDPVYSCHIPSSGKLTTELCMDSFQKAYEFFKPYLKGTVLPILCRSWLLHEPYANEVFPEGSNMQKFARMFDVFHNSPAEFTECWRVFGKYYEGTTEGLPADNTLRRNFIQYINNGGTFGNGSGMILYDGEKREIINR